MSDSPSSIYSKLRSLKSLFAIGSIAGVAFYLYKKKNSASQQRAGSSGKNEKGKGTDKEFFQRLQFVLKTGMPSLWCRETITATALAITLLSRTAMTVYITNLIGNFVHTLCARDWIGCRNAILTFTLAAIPATGMNAALRFLTQALKAHVREKLSMKVHQLYMQNMNYYKINKLGKNCLENTDQLIAEDIDKFSDILAEVYSNLLKPLVDFLLFSLQLKIMLGTRGPLTMIFWFSFASAISSVVLPAYGRLAVENQKLEGTFRARHVRVIDSCEMIAFNGGEIPEKRIIDGSFLDIKRHQRKFRWTQLFSNIIMGYLNKYTASTVGLLLVCAPFYFEEGNAPNMTSEDIASFYVGSTRIMQGQAEAVLRLFEVQKLVGKLSGLTFRVWTLINALKNPEKIELPTESDNPAVFAENETLTFKNVSIFRPDGALLVKHLNFSVPQGTRFIVTGENGVGKSSLFRVLKGLWPLSVGTIETPPLNSLKSFYFLSQDNFVPIGSLREIIIYPLQLKDMKAAGKTDEDLWEVLQWANLADLKLQGVRPNMDTVTDWDVDLSPGQKQRMAFARLLYHQPKYAILDDCTNGVAPDVEMDLYRRCRDLDITAITISHKSELKQLHDYELFFDGHGGYKLINLQH